MREIKECKSRGTKIKAKRYKRTETGARIRAVYGHVKEGTNEVAERVKDADVRCEGVRGEKVRNETL